MGNAGQLCRAVVMVMVMVGLARSLPKHRMTYAICPIDAIYAMSEVLLWFSISDLMVGRGGGAGVLLANSPPLDLESIYVAIISCF